MGTSKIQRSADGAVLTDERLLLTDLSAIELADRLELKPFQGRQIFGWLHKRNQFDFDQMTDLSKELRERLKRDCDAGTLELAACERSERSGTKKALFRLRDGESVEAVLIRDRDRVTLCVSSQVGCAVKCSFCATGIGGYARNLSPGEIVEQVFYLLKDEDLGERSPNIVFMGMGEPFRNYESVLKSIRLMMAPEGLGIGARRITVSTAGEAPRIEEFASEDWQVRLSVSLHAANDSLRDQLVPLNRKYNLSRLRQAVSQYQERTGRLVTFEWALLDGVNDSIEHAKELLRWAEGLVVHVNVIPYNPVEGLPYAAPSRRTCEKFRDTLSRGGMNVTFRSERGQDIDAACGQLRRRQLASH